MATSNEAKNTSSTEKKEDVEKKEESKKETSSESSATKLIDGRIFEADNETSLSAEEAAELKEFEMVLKKYNDLARKLRKDALKEEREELNEADKSPKVKYYEGSRTERIKVLETETKLMEDMEKKVGQPA